MAIPIFHHSWPGAIPESYHEILMALPDGVTITDTNGKILRVNPKALEIYGCKKESEAIATLASQKEVLNFENRYRCQDGSYRWIEWRSYPQGKEIYAVARDITERKEAEVKMQDQLNELQRWHKVMIGREGRNMELKQEINDLLVQLGKPKKYR